MSTTTTITNTAIKECPLNLVQVIYDDDIVSIINAMSTRIKEFYINNKQRMQYINNLHSSIGNRMLLIKTIIHDNTINDGDCSNNKNTFMNDIICNVDKGIDIHNTLSESIAQVNNDSNTLIEDVKEYFKQIKYKRRKKIEDLVNKNNNNTETHMNALDNKSKQNESNTPKANITKRNNNNKINTFTSVTRSISSRDNNKLQKQAQCSLANNILQFLIDISPLINKQTHPQLDTFKHEIQSQANKILIKDYSSSFSPENYHYTALTKYQQDNQHKVSLLDKANTQINTLQSQLTTITNETNDIKSHLSKLSTITLSSIDQNALITSLQTEILSLKNELSSTQQQLTEQTSLLQASNSNNTTQTNKLQDELTKMTSLYNDKLNKVNKLQTEINTLNKTLKTNNDKITLLETNIKDNDIRLSKYQKQIKQIQTQRSKDANKYIHKDNLLQDKSKLIESLSTENNVNKKVIQTLNNEISKMEGVIKLQIVQINQQKLELETMKQTYTFNHPQENEIKMLKAKINELENKLKEDKQSLIDNYTNQINVLEQQKQFIEDTIKNKQEKCNDIIAGYDKYDVVGQYVYRNNKEKLMWYLLKKKNSDNVYDNMLWMDEIIIKDTLVMYNECIDIKEKSVEELKDIIQQKEEEIKEIKLKFNKVLSNMMTKNENENLSENTST